MEAVKDVPVATVATGYVTPFGDTVILIMHEALFFGESLQHTLINPNQIRHFGVPVNDNPFDTGSPFGISHDDLFMPFSTRGPMVLFETFTRHLSK